MTKTLHALGVAAVAAVATLAGAPALAAETYSNWDNFNGATRINPTKWLSTERVREISGGTLNMQMREYGMQTDNTGYYNESWSTSIERNAAAITQLQAKVAVKAYRVTGCAANANPSFIQTRLGGGFFNVGSATSRIDDVSAVIRLVRYSNSADPTNVWRVEALASRCTTTDCNYNTETLFQQDLGTATVGSAIRLAVEWDAAGNRFAYRRGDDPKVFYNYAARFADDSTPAFLPGKFVGTRVNLANCFAGARTEGFVSTTFDDLAVNTSAK